MNVIKTMDLSSNSVSVGATSNSFEDLDIHLPKMFFSENYTKPKLNSRTGLNQRDIDTLFKFK